MKSIFYRILKWYVTLGLRLYFSRIEIVGARNLPVGKPFILAPNHQNAFLDALVAGLLVPIDCHFLARADIFNKYSRWFLEMLKIAPIYRMRDGYSEVNKNTEVFDGCTRLFEQDQTILIFPEGDHREEYFLRPLAKGVARIALQSQRFLNKELYIVPCGLNYFHHKLPRTKLIMVYGDPISIAEHVKGRSNDGVAMQTASLISRLSDGIKECMVLPEKELCSEENVARVFSQENQSRSFDSLRAQANAHDATALTTVEMGWQGSQFLGALITLLSIPNLVPLVFLKIVLNRFENPAWWASIKFVVMLFSMPIWLGVLFALGFALAGPGGGCVAVMVSVASLFVRAELRKRFVS